MIWFIADTHYSHTNIVRGVSKWTDKSGCRDFDTLEQHDDWLVAMINTKVKEGDTLYHLGDWSFGGKDKIKEFSDRLFVNDIRIILGNHDHHIANDIGRAEWTCAWGITPKHYMEFDYKGLQLVLMHYPLESWNNMERGTRHLHGHTHGQLGIKNGRIDVGVDALGLVSLDQIALTPLATDQRHPTIHGGNKFA